MATIKDVAARAGVSFTTVSHVLNETRPVMPATRARVLDAARELDYVPSAVARALRHRTTHTLGVLVPNSTNPFFAELARGIEDACYRAGYTSILCSSDDAPERQRTYLNVLRQKRVDGLVVASASDDERWVSQLRELRTPLLVVDRAISGLEADLVQVDGRRGGALAAEHLLALGHRRVACIAGPGGFTVSRARLEGFVEALARAGVAMPDAHIAPGDFRPEGGYQAARALLALVPRPTAIFACNDLMAVGALRAATELQLAVPGQLSIVGFDGIELARYVHPSLSTVVQPTHELGALTVEVLLGRLRGAKGPAVRRTVAPVFQARESTGPAPAD